MNPIAKFLFSCVFTSLHNPDIHCTTNAQSDPNVLINTEGAFAVYYWTVKIKLYKQMTKITGKTRFPHTGNV